MLPSSMHTPWAESKSYNLSELNTIQGGVASPCLSSSLPFCVRFNRALPLEIQLYSQAATLDTKPLAKSYLGGSHSHLPSNHFQYARASLGYPRTFGNAFCILLRSSSNALGVKRTSPLMIAFGFRSVTNASTALSSRFGQCVSVIDVIGSEHRSVRPRAVIFE